MTPGTASRPSWASPGIGKLWQLRVPLPAEAPRWPTGVRVRTFEPGRDEAAWLELNNRAFKNDPDQSGWVEETLRRREDEPWFEPVGFLLAVDEQGLAGFCWTRLHPAAPPVEPVPLGEIYVIGVDPDRQGSGLGRALTLGGARRSPRPPARAGRDALRRRRVHRRGRPVPFAGLHAGPRRLGVRRPVLTRYGATREELVELLADQPRYRVDQVWDALWRRRIPLDDATELPVALRARLAEQLPLSLTSRVEAASRDGLTTKWLWATGTGAEVETVLMRSPRRGSVCVSSQAGCAMGCTFCATGQAGFEQHLSATEIVEQVVRAQHASPQRVTNVVYMGMGEPLANFDPVWASIVQVHERLGISARRITVSTVGVVPGMRRLATASAAGDPRRLPPRSRRRAAPPARPPRRPVPDRRGARRGGRGRGGEGPAGDVRVRGDPGRERQPHPGRRGQGGSWPPGRGGRRPREPDPAEPDRGVPGPGPPRLASCTSSPGGSRPTGWPPRCGGTAGPTSTPPAGSSAAGA